MDQWERQTAFASPRRTSNKRKDKAEGKKCERKGGENKQAPVYRIFREKTRNLKGGTKKEGIKPSEESLRGGG